MRKNILKSCIIVGTICLFILVAGNIFSTASIQKTSSLYTKNTDQVQRIFIVGTITDYDNSLFNQISFYGKNGFYISVGWKGFHMGQIRELHFTIYETSFHGFIKECFIIGVGIQQSGPFNM